MAPAERPSGGKRRREATARLLEELAALRGITREVAENVLLELDGGLAGLETYLGPDGGARPRVRDLEAALEAVGRLRVKPWKGRVGDLRRIRDLLRTLEELLEG